jgi:predicted phage terminase large subunit-like protein
LATRHLAEFAKQAWHVLEPATELKWGWALDAICEHLEAVTSGDIRRLLMNVPPGSMKSLLTGVIWPAWEWGPRDLQSMRYLGTAHKQELAVRDNMKCRRLIQSDWYQARWPIELTSDQNAKTKFENAKTGFREAMAFASMTGSRGDRVILDDPHSVDDANSVATLKSDIITFREALPSRVNNDRSAIAIIMQRLNEADVSSVAIELGYDHLMIPMRYEPKRARVTRIGWADPRTQDGELMFPDRFPEEQVIELENTMGSYATAGQLQQRPAPRGGGIIKTDWFRYYRDVPPLEWRAIFADTAQKTGEANDFSVFQCWGRSLDGQAVMLDQVRGKWEAPELLEQARRFWLKHKAAVGSPLRAMNVEDKVSGTGLIQTLRREGVPILPVARNRMAGKANDKVSRGYDAAPFIESGNVWLPEWTDWLDTFLAECSTFPAGAHDDQLDPMFDAIHSVQFARADARPVVVPVPRMATGFNRRRA